MIYKGYRFHVLILTVVFLFVIGFIFQIQHLQKRLTEFEKLNRFLYSHLLDKQFNDLFHIEKISDLSDRSEQGFYKTVDSIIVSRLKMYFSPEEIMFKLSDTKDSVLYSHNIEHSPSCNIFCEKTEFFNAAVIQFAEREEIIIKVPDIFKKQHNFIVRLIVILSLMFSLITVGIIVFILEREKKIQKIRMDVINNMTHEFKTPLTSVKLISEMIMQQGSALSEDKLKHYARIINQEVNKLLRQAKQFLNTAYYEEKRMQLRKRLYNIHGLIQYIVDSYQTVFTEGEVNISTNLKATDPVVITDRNHFINVLTNLIVNAHKYAKNNQVDICISTFNEHNKLYIEVSDNGIGIDPKYHKMIFNRFYRVPSGNIHEKSGYGVGLFYVKNVLQQMNADIRVKSRLGQGSTFIIQMRNNKNNTP